MAESHARTVLNLHRPTRREALLALGAVAAGALALDATAIDRHDVIVEQHTMRLPRLQPPFYGMRIVQLSDFHTHEYAETRYLRRVVAQVNALKPDAVLMTGDYITAIGDVKGGWVQSLPVCAEILRGLTAPVRICTLGNHDCIDAPAVTKALRNVGLTVLYNAHTAITRGGERLVIAGIADAYYDRPDLGLAVPAASPQAPVLLMGHEPDYADTVAQYGGVDYMLAGHTHGGQVRLAGLTPYFLPKLGRKYVRGHFELGAMQLYVNRGIGAVHLPVRFRCPPEITLFTLAPMDRGLAG